MDVVSFCRTDCAMLNKADRVEWRKTCRGMESKAFSQYLKHTNEDEFSALRYCNNKGLIVQGFSVQIKRAWNWADNADYDELPDDEEWNKEDYDPLKGPLDHFRFVVGNNYHDIALLMINSNSIDIHGVDSLGWTPLMNASCNDSIKSVEALLAAKVDVNAKSKLDCTALLFASRYGHIEVVKALLEAGASTGILNYQKETAKSLAMHYNMWMCVNVLHEAEQRGQ